MILANMLYMGMGIPAGMTCGVITDRYVDNYDNTYTTQYLLLFLWPYISYNHLKGTAQVEKFPKPAIKILLSFRWGRKKATVLYLSWIGIASLASSFSVNMTMYIVLRCLTAFPSGAVWDSTSALCEYSHHSTLI